MSNVTQSLCSTNMARIHRQRAVAMYLNKLHWSSNSSWQFSSWANTAYRIYCKPPRLNHHRHQGECSLWLIVQMVGMHRASVFFPTDSREIAWSMLALSRSTWPFDLRTMLRRSQSRGGISLPFVRIVVKGLEPLCRIPVTCVSPSNCLQAP